jgi:hypothetical protein
VRTTVTLDPDIVQSLKEVGRIRGLKPKAAINEALRRGLREMKEQKPPSPPFELKSAKLGELHLGGQELREVLADMDAEECLERQRR